MKCYQIHGKAKLVLQRGDLTKWKGDAIVNAGRDRASYGMFELLMALDCVECMQ